MIMLKLFYTFFKIGLFTFGGGYAMLPLIQSEVLSHDWMSLEQIVDFIAVAESTPGPFAVNMATYIGTRMGGVAGAVCATVGVVLPSFIIILLISGIYIKFKSSFIVSGAMRGLRPAVIGLIGSALVSVAMSVFLPLGFSGFVLDMNFAASLLIFAVSLALILKKMHPIAVMGIAAALGIGFGYLSEII